MKYLLLIIFWGVYGAIHSIFASTRVKILFKYYFPVLFPYYRMIYAGFAVILLIPVLIYQSILPQRFLFSQSVILIAIGLLISTAGIMIVIVSFKYYDVREFIGIRQLKGNDVKEKLQTSGPLNHVRHPLYSGSILALGGYFIFAPSIPNLIMGICLTLYFLIGIRFEEKKLIREFGKAYIEYRKEVPSLIPRIKKYI